MPTYLVIVDRIVRETRQIPVDAASVQEAIARAVALAPNVDAWEAYDTEYMDVAKDAVQELK